MGFQGAEGVAKVLGEGVEPGIAPDGAAVFAEEGLVAEAAAGFVVRMETLGAELLVEAHFRGEVVFQAAAVEEEGDAASNFA
jgi:hypothetical protein